METDIITAQWKRAIIIHASWLGQSVNMNNAIDQLRLKIAIICCSKHVSFLISSLYPDHDLCTFSAMFVSQRYRNSRCAFKNIISSMDMFQFEKKCSKM